MSNSAKSATSTSAPASRKMPATTPTSLRLYDPLRSDAANAKTFIWAASDFSDDRHGVIKCSRAFPPHVADRALPDRGGGGGNGDDGARRARARAAPLLDRARRHRLR